MLSMGKRLHGGDRGRWGMGLVCEGVETERNAHHEK